MMILLQCACLFLAISSSFTEAAASPPRERPTKINGAENLRRLQHDAREHRISFLETSSGILKTASRKELRGIMGKGDTYDASLFSEEHAAFKATHNRIFAELGTRMTEASSEKGEGLFFYLDGVDGSTTKALLASSSINGGQLLTANRHIETCDAITKVADSCGGSTVRVIHDTALSALSTHPQTGSIVAYYFDACSGLVEPLLDIFKVVLEPGDKHRRHPEICFGVTLTNACPSGESLLDREQRLLSQVKQLSAAVGYKYMHRVADEPERWGIRGSTPLPRFVDQCLTTWIVVSRLAA